MLLLRGSLHNVRLVVVLHRRGQALGVQLQPLGHLGTGDIILIIISK